MRVGILGLLFSFVLALAAVAETRVLLCYDSIDGHTRQVAEWIAQAVQEQPDTSLRFKRVEDTTHEDLVWADVIMVGSPVYNAGLTQGVSKFLAEWPFDGSPLKNRVGGAFVSSKGATAGAENALFSILKTMMLFRMVIVGGEDWRSGFGVVYVQDGMNETTLGFVKEQSRNFAFRLCRVARETRQLRER